MNALSACRRLTGRLENGTLQIMLSAVIYIRNAPQLYPLFHELLVLKEAWFTHRPRLDATTN